jgi:hypothetical protein
VANSQKPGRPFGLSLAIILCVVYFSLLPLIYAVWLTWLRWRFDPARFAEPFMTEGGEVLSGVGGLPEVNLIQVTIAVIFLVIAFFAWRGRPSSMRFVLMFSIIGITLYNLAVTLSIPPQTPETGFDSSAQLNATLATFQVISGLLIVLYVLWYINRAPARAFYRGYYLPEPKPESAASVPAVVSSEGEKSGR